MSSFEYPCFGAGVSQDIAWRTRKFLSPVTSLICPSNSYNPSYKQTDISYNNDLNDNIFSSFLQEDFGNIPNACILFDRPSDAYKSALSCICKGTVFLPIRIFEFWPGQSDTYTHDGTHTCWSFRPKPIAQPPRLEGGSTVTSSL